MDDQPISLSARRADPSVDEILAALIGSNVLETLEITTDDAEARAGRTETFVTALVAAPLGAGAAAMPDEARASGGRGHALPS